MRILVVDDESDVRAVLRKVLLKFGHQVETAADGQAALDLYHAQDFDVIISDIRMPRLDGMELLRRVKEIERSPVDVIMITAHGDMDNAIAALRSGAFDYLRKPINLEELEVTLERIAGYRSLLNRFERLKTDFDSQVRAQTKTLHLEAERLRQVYLEEVGLGELEIYSTAMRNLFRLAEKYGSENDLNVLIQGESGTGKELLARYLHYFGQGDPLNPFVAVNCGAIAPELFESEFFGHESGAFTGASRTGRQGKVQAAGKGTLFLDEIGEMPETHQIKLLRILEEKTYYRLGGNKELDVKARIVCATNKNLAQEVEAGRFRLDLFYRINAAVLHIPPLRERREEILPLAKRLVSRASARRGHEFGRFSRRAERLLMEHPWPGNVRQLKNLMDRLALFGPWDVVRADDIPFSQKNFVISDGPDTSPTSQLVLGQDDFLLPEEGLDLNKLTNDLVLKAFEINNQNISQTARYLGLTRRVLQTKLKKIGSA